MPDSRQTTEDIMRKTFDEAPHFWPHGLSMSNFDSGRGEGVFLVRAKQAAMVPVGFVGWQERREGTEKIGYYSVGILPDHRGKGYAKEAVAKLIGIKSGNVDRVVALIEKGNAPSQALATSLGVQIKTAGNLFTGDISAKLDSTAGKVNGMSEDLSAMHKLMDERSRNSMTAGGSALGGAAGYIASDLIPDSVRRKKQLRVLATLLGAGGGALAGHHFS